jgi:quercetin dioxygenase-like cupin family protein
MRYFITGTDDRGQSLIASVTERTGPVAAQAAHEIYRGPATPPAQPAQSGGRQLDVAQPPGETTWRVVEFPPGLSVASHHTASIDFITLIEGAVELGTDAETVSLAPGDSVLVNGVNHSWHTEPGCRLLVAMLTTARP